jgi:hypothetical protein
MPTNGLPKSPCGCGSAPKLIFAIAKFAQGGALAGIEQVSTQPSSIFVSIASYCDPQLVPTVRDCLEKARHPEQLRFGICWQHASDEELPDWFCGDRFNVLDVDCRESRGANWARA